MRVATDTAKSSDWRQSSYSIETKETDAAVMPITRDMRTVRRMADQMATLYQDDFQSTPSGVNIAATNSTNIDQFVNGRPDVLIETIR